MALQTRPVALVDAPASADPVDLLDFYRSVRAQTERLCAPLAVEDFVIQSMPDASPVKWHLAHTAWFFEQFVLQNYTRDYRWFDERFRYLFNSYYEAVGPRHARPQRGIVSRPTVGQVFAYRAHVDERMIKLLGGRAESVDLSRIVTLGLHHEQQHQELLLTDLKHAFSCNPLLPAYTTEVPRERNPAPPLSFFEVKGGLTDVGHAGPAFSFDNELPRHRTHLPDFLIANRPVTNSEFREFVDDGGYKRAEHWLSDGWTTVQSERWAHPFYWADALDSEFTLAGERGIDPHAPVCHLSYFEADAFARWAGARLPTEFEWESVAAGLPIDGNFVEARNWRPVSTSPSNRASPSQMFGDVWEWTQSSYSPYPGFRPATGAVGEYNGKFMVSQLVLRGGSCATPRSHIRSTYRNFFYPSARWQFTGARLAKDVS